MRIITRTVIILSLVSLFADVASELLYPVIPVYLSSIGLPVVWIGLMEGVANFIAGLTKGYFGKRSDEKGERLPFVRYGYTLSAIAKPLMVIFSLPVWIIFTRTLDRLGKGVRTAARDALLSDEATPTTKARVFGFHRGMDTVGATIGPVLALVFLYFHPGEYKTLFYYAFIPGLISIALIFFLHEKKKTITTVRKGGFFSYLRYYKTAEPRYRRLAAGLLAFALFNSSDMFLLLQAQHAIGDQVIHLGSITLHSGSITIAAYVFYNLIFALSAYPLGVLADHFGTKKVFTTGLLLFAIVYGGFASSPSLLFIFVLFFLYGIFSGLTEGISKAWISNIARKEQTATAIGFYTSAESIATLIASITGGLLWTYTGAASAFFVPAIVAVIVFIYFSFFTKD